MDCRNKKVYMYIYLYLIESKNIIAKEQGRQSDYYESKNIIGKEQGKQSEYYESKNDDKGGKRICKG